MSADSRFELDYALVADDTCEESALLFPFMGHHMQIGLDGGLLRPQAVRPWGKPLRTLRFGALAGCACVLQVWPSGQGVSEVCANGDYRALWGKWPSGRLDALVRARQLATWILHNRYCGACGHEMEPSATEIACLCPYCGYRAYPRISPVAMGLIVRGDEILLARSPHFPPGMYSALAGFVEAGESVEDCLRREVREEVDIEIHNIRYFGSQSWPYPHSLMMGFIADYHSGELSFQTSEIEDANWFRLDHLPMKPHSGSLARQMVEFVLRSLDQ